MTTAISSSKFCQADPGAIDDETVSESCALRGIGAAGEDLAAGEVHITMRLRAIEDGCRVEMDEVAISVPPKLRRWL
jgi:hypothetical protein